MSLWVPLGYVTLTCLVLLLGAVALNALSKLSPEAILGGLVVGVFVGGLSYAVLLTDGVVGP